MFSRLILGASFKSLMGQLDQEHALLIKHRLNNRVAHSRRIDSGTKLID